MTLLVCHCHCGAPPTSAWRQWQLGGLASDRCWRILTVSFTAVRTAIVGFAALSRGAEFQVILTENIIFRLLNNSPAFFIFNHSHLEHFKTLATNDAHTTGKQVVGLRIRAVGHRGTPTPPSCLLPHPSGYREDTKSPWLGDTNDKR